MFDQRRRLISDLSKLLAIGGAMKIEHWPNMQKPGGGVAVITRLQPERTHDLLQSRNVSGQLRGSHRRVLNEGDRFGRTDATGQKIETGFAHRPDQFHFARIGQNFGAQTELARLQDRQSLGDIFVKLDEQDRRARFGIELEQIARGLEVELAFGLI